MITQDQKWKNHEWAEGSQDVASIEAGPEDLPKANWPLTQSSCHSLRSWMQEKP